MQLKPTKDRKPKLRWRWIVRNFIRRRCIQGSTETMKLGTNFQHRLLSYPRQLGDVRIPWMLIIPVGGHCRRFVLEFGLGSHAGESKPSCIDCMPTSTWSGLMAVVTARDHTGHHQERASAKNPMLTGPRARKVPAVDKGVVYDWPMQGRWFCV